MKSPLEKRFKEKVQKDLNTLENVWYFKSQERAVRGIPDIVMCLNGYFVALELKRSDKSVISALQVYTIHSIKSKGQGTAYVACPENWGKIFPVLKKIDQYTFSN